MNKSARQRLWHTLRLWLIPNSYIGQNILRSISFSIQLVMAALLWKEKFLCMEILSLWGIMYIWQLSFLITHDAIHLCPNRGEIWSQV